MRAALALCVFVVACDGCDGPHEPVADVALPAPEAWTLGAARGEDLVLPPPCRGESSLAAVMARATQIVAVRGVLDHVVAVEGTLEPTRGLPAWRPDAAGVMAMTHGRSAPVASLPWSAGARVARAGPSWLVVRESGGALVSWRDGVEQRLGPAERPVDLFCDDAICGLLSRDDGPRLRIRGLDESEWRDVPLPKELGAFAIAGAGEREGTLVVVLADALRLHFFEAQADGLRPLGSLQAPNGALAAASLPPHVLVRAGFDPSGCNEQGGGASLVSTGGALPLRSALPAETAALATLPGGGLFAAWLAPVRCGATARALHAVVVAADGSLAGPVTTVAEADAFALASDGDRVALWLEHRAAAAGRGTVTWVPMRCALSEAAP